MRTTGKTDYYVYVYCDPRKPGKFEYDNLNFTFNYQPFYIGIGTGYRYRRHVTKFEINWNYNSIKNGKIKHIINDGFDPLKYVVFLKENILRIEAQKLEIDIIKMMGRICDKTGILTNLTLGGEDTAVMTSKIKGKTYEEIYGIERASEIKEIRRQHLKGNKYGEKTRGKKMSEEGKENLRKKKQLSVKQLNKNYDLIKIWESPAAAAKFLGISVSGIHNTLTPNHRAISAGGYYWEYEIRENIKYKK